MLQSFVCGQIILLLVASVQPISIITQHAQWGRPSSTILNGRKGALNRNNKGFGRKSYKNVQTSIAFDDNSSSQQSPMSDNPQRIYSMPALYDLAFGYRNFEYEVDFLLHAHELYTTCGSPATNVLELAAGPARHSLAALAKEKTLVQQATALDNSPEMVHYATELAFQELGIVATTTITTTTPLSTQTNPSLTYLLGDMRNFSLPPTYHTAWILLGSLQHMTTNNDVCQCFRNVHHALLDGGTLILELPHPRETFSMVECTRNGWEVPLEDESGAQYGELQIVWGDDNDTFDPITQIRQFSISMKIKSDDHVQSDLKSVSEIVPIRLFTSQEISALAAQCGFEMAAMFGALDEEIHVDDDDAFRLE